MVAEASFELHGLDAALDKMKQVQDLPRTRANRFALRKAANVVREAAEINARRLDDPKTSNSIADNLVVRFDGKRFRQTGDMKMSVGIRGGASSRQANQRNPGGDTYYWRFLEFGTAHQRAQPFMRPALADNIDAATDEYLRHLDKALTRAIRRANRGR